ncbi:MAG: hypothetical protein OXR68_03215 [Alphaproteobacteria bacterium]|nr:hypothetical protein [Alphaproteobacteria bacterium]MDD9919615.1 hypothetical protein [Alphaproteobacteria bacterium]
MRAHKTFNPQETYPNRQIILFCSAGISGGIPSNSSKAIHKKGTDIVICGKRTRKSDTGDESQAEALLQWAAKNWDNGGVNFNHTGLAILSIFPYSLEDAYERLVQGLPHGVMIDIVLDSTFASAYEAQLRAINEEFFKDRVKIHASYSPISSSYANYYNALLFLRGAISSTGSWKIIKFPWQFFWFAVDRAINKEPKNFVTKFLAWCASKALPKHMR